MSTKTITAANTTFKIGWITLQALSVIFIVWHIALIFIDKDPLLFAWVAFPLYAAVTLLVPFRRGEKWAWYASWIMVFGFASPFLFLYEISSMIGVYYLGVAGVMALALLLTRPTFFQKEA